MKLTCAIIVAITLVVPEIKHKFENAKSKRRQEKMLEIKNVSKTFAKDTVNEHKALNNINLTLNDGEFVTIVGSNGAGKSTLFNMICGTFEQDSGSIILDGKDISFMPEHKRARLVGRVFQDPMKGTAPNMTIEENLALAYSRAGSSFFSQAIGKRKENIFKSILHDLIWDLKTE